MGGGSWQTVTDNPSALTSTSFGSWNQSISASVSEPFSLGNLFPESYAASASQNSTIILDTSIDQLTATGSGEVRFDDGSGVTTYTTQSTFSLIFSIESGQYEYNFGVFRYYGGLVPVSTGFNWGGNFAPNSTGVIGPGNYWLSINFYDMNAVTLGSLYGPYSFTPYEFSFLVATPSVPIPGAVWLLGSGLLGLAGWRRFRKN